MPRTDEESEKRFIEEMTIDARLRIFRARRSGNPVDGLRSSVVVSLPRPKRTDPPSARQRLKRRVGHDADDHEQPALCGTEQV